MKQRARKKAKHRTYLCVPQRGGSSVYASLSAKQFAVGGKAIEEALLQGGVVYQNLKAK